MKSISIFGMQNYVYGELLDNLVPWIRLIWERVVAFTDQKVFSKTN